MGGEFFIRFVNSLSWSGQNAILSYGVGLGVGVVVWFGGVRVVIIYRVCKVTELVGTECNSVLRIKTKEPP